MKKQKGMNLVFVIIAVIVGSGLWKQFDFQDLTFDKPALAAVYGLAFVASLYFILRDYTKPA